MNAIAGAFIQGPGSERRPVTNIYCAGRNYRDHAREMHQPEPASPIFFQKSLACLTSGPDLTLPPESDIHHELELVLAIQQAGYEIPAEQAWDYVGALGLGLDLTDRPLQAHLKQQGLPWFLSKSFPDAAVVTKFHHPDRKVWSREFWLLKNGKRVQSGSLDQMIFSIPRLIEYLSARIPLMAGDLIFTGTPSGVGPLRSGDELRLGLGDRELARFYVR